MKQKPLQTEIGEWQYCGCIIQSQDHPKLKPFHVFENSTEQVTLDTCFTFTEAKKIAEEHQKQ